MHVEFNHKGKRNNSSKVIFKVIYINKKYSSVSFVINLYLIIQRFLLRLMRLI